MYFSFVEEAELPSAGIDSVLVLGPVSFESDECFFFDGLDGSELWEVFPDFQGELVCGICECDVEVWFVRLGCFGDAFLELGVYCSCVWGFSCLLFKL